MAHLPPDTRAVGTPDPANDMDAVVDALAAITGATPGGSDPGSGTVTAQKAMDTLAGAVTSGLFLRGNGTHAVMAAIQAGDVPALSYAALLTPTGTKTSAYTAAPGDFVPCDTATTGAFTVTLPTAPAAFTTIGIKLIKQTGTNAVTIATGGSDVFNVAGGSATLTLSLLFQGVILQYRSSGNIWYVTSDDLPLGQLDSRYVLVSALPLAIASGGTGAATQQAALDALAGAVTNNQVLAGNGTHVTLRALAAADLPTVPIAGGGTGQTAANAGFNALSPMTTLGDITYEDATPKAVRLAGNTTSTKNFFTQTGTGSVSAAPAWGTIAFGDVPTDSTTPAATSTAGATGSATTFPRRDHVHAQNYLGLFGDGSDGAVTLDGTTDFTSKGFGAPSSSTYTMTRDVFCTNLTINNGVTVQPNGYRFFCQGTFTNSGTVTVAGTAGLAAGGGGGGGGAAGTIGFGRAGGGGGNLTNGTAGTSSNSAGTGTAGSGGGSGGNTGGGGGTGGSAGTSWFKTPGAALAGTYAVLGTQTILNGGPGGGGGAGDGTTRGGGGGGGGGVVVVFAWAANNGSGTISAAGGAGGSPSSGTNNAGGGGGSGGLILIYTLSAWTAGTTNVAAGGAGTGRGTATAASAGAAGTVLNQVLA